MDIDIENIEDLKNNDSALKILHCQKRKLMNMVEPMLLVKERMPLYASLVKTWFRHN